MVDNVRLPVGVEQGAVGGPRFRTTINVATSGKEQRIAEWDLARGEWDISYGIQTLEDLRDVIKLYYARMGRAFPFRFKDWSDYQATSQSIGTGDGTTAAFQLVKTYTDTVLTYSRTILLPVSGTLRMFVAGVEKFTNVSPPEWTANYSTGVVTFAAGHIPTAGQAVTATFDFDVPVRFDDDHLKISLTTSVVGSIPPITISEVIGE